MKRSIFHATAIATLFTLTARVAMPAVTIPHDIADASKLLALSATSCYISTDRPYVVRSRAHDALRYRRYLDAAPDREVAVASTDYNEFRVALNVDADWQLSRYSTSDGSVITLSHLSAPLVSELSYYKLHEPAFTPETQRNIHLEDPVGRVFAIFGHGDPVRDQCGRTHYVFGWETAPGARDTIDYEVRAGRIVSISAGSGCCGILTWATPK